MAVHSPVTHEQLLEMDLAAIFNNLMETLRFLPNPCLADKGHPEADFHHLVSGMDAAYYSYLL